LAALIIAPIVAIGVLTVVVVVLMAVAVAIGVMIVLVGVVVVDGLAVVGRPAWSRMVDVGLGVVRFHQPAPIHLQHVLADLPHQDFIGGSEGEQLLPIVVLIGVQFVSLPLLDLEADDILPRDELVLGSEISNGDVLQFVELVVDYFGRDALADHPEVLEDVLLERLAVEAAHYDSLQRFLGLLDSDVDDSPVAVEEPADGLHQDPPQEFGIGEVVLLVLLRQGLRLLDDFAVVEVAPAAEEG
jgi:hypothetical protein